MITKLDDILNYSPVILLYPAGASGEAFAYTITQSFPDVSKSPHHWENGSRCKMLDFFNRSLTTGLNEVTEELVVKGVNIFLDHVIDLKDRNIALSHHNHESLNFIQEFLPKVPVIEVTTYTDLSKKFRHIGIKNKITPVVNAKAVRAYTNCGIRFRHHLQIEWSDLFLTNPMVVLKRLEEFLGMSGDQEIFISVINDYLVRNKSLIDQIV